MLTLMHNSRVILSVVCALFVVSTLSFALRSDAADMAPLPIATPSAVTDIEGQNSAPVSPYQIEGIPGGDGTVGDFVVGPGKADITIEPGESKVVYMTVTNRTGESRKFNITIEDAAGTEDERTPVKLLGDDRGPYSLRDYLSVPQRVFELGHNQRARIPVTVSIPEDAEPGGRYGSVLVDTVALESNIGDTEATIPQSAIVARIGTLFFLTIPGSVTHEGRMKDFGTLEKQIFFKSGPITFGILHENTGSIHIAPYGEISVANIFGEEVGLVSLEPWFILPGSVRLRELIWDREFLLGRYTATAEIYRGYDDKVDVATFSFWVLPWKILLGAFTLVFVVVFLIRAFFKTFEFKRKT